MKIMETHGSKNSADEVGYVLSLAWGSEGDHADQKGEQARKASLALVKGRQQPQRCGETIERSSRLVECKKQLEVWSMKNHTYKHQADAEKGEDSLA